MTSLTSLLLFVTFILFITCSSAQDRAPHGLTYAGPVAFSPEAYDFFHPNTQTQNTKGSCSTPECSALPLAATVQSTPAQESKSPPEGGRKRLGGHSLVGIPVGLVFALLVGLGAYYAFITRRSNAARAKAAQLQTDV